VARKRDFNCDISLFPFLSVLCALMGVLTLFLLLAMNSRVMESAAAAPATTPASLPVADSNSSGLSEPEYEKLRVEIEELVATLAARRKEYAELAQLQSELSDLLASKQELLDKSRMSGLLQGIDLQSKEDVQLVPDSQFVVSKTPRFLEVSAIEYVLQPEGRRFPVNELQVDGSNLQQFLDDLDSRRESEYLLLLIHPDGTDAFDNIHNYVQRKFPSQTDNSLPRIAIGFEPYSAGWVLISHELAKASSR
jgi:hypothetical protein